MSFCGSCGAEMYRDSTCPAPSCPEKGMAAWIQHFCQPLRIPIASPTVKALMDSGKLRDPSDLYNLEQSDVTKTGETLAGAKEILRGIEASKSAPAAHVIMALGIAGMTTQAAQSLQLAYPDLWALSGADETDLVRAVGMNALPRQIRYYFERPDAIELVTNLTGFGVGRSAVPPKPGKSVRSKSVCFTGTLKSMVRDEAHKLIRQAGGYVDNTVTRSTDILVVVPDDAGASKLKKASDYGTEQWTEDDFCAAVGVSPLARRR